MGKREEAFSKIVSRLFVHKMAFRCKRRARALAHLTMGYGIRLGLCRIIDGKGSPMERPQPHIDMQGFVQGGSPMFATSTRNGLPAMRGPHLRREIQEQHTDLDRTLNSALMEMEGATKAQDNMQKHVKKWTQKKRQVTEGYRHMGTIKKTWNDFEEMATAMQQAILQPWVFSSHGDSTSTLQKAESHAQNTDFPSQVSTPYSTNAVSVSSHTD